MTALGSISLGMMSRPKYLGCLLVLFCCAGSYGYAQSAAFADQIRGNWKGQGLLFSSPAQFEMSWTKVLGERFVQMDFVNSFERDGKQYEMQAQAMYQFKEGKISGTWFDSRGQILPLNATLKNNTLTTLWGDETTERGKTVYQLTESGQMIVEDFVLQKWILCSFW